MSMRAWCAAGGAAAVAIELGAGAVALSQLGPVRIALYPLACAVASGLVAFALWRLLGHDSGGPGRGDGPEGADGDRPPPWWPEFERDLHEYARERARASAGHRS